MSVSSYFWYAYDTAATAGAAAAERVKNIRQEDVIHAANKVKDAAATVIKTISNTCVPAWNLISPPVVEGAGEPDPEAENEGWEIVEPGAPGGPRLRPAAVRKPPEDPYD